MMIGPPIQQLTRRLAGCPSAFLGDPLIAERGEVRVDAVVADILHDLGMPLGRAEVYREFSAEVAVDRNWLRVVLVAAWLIHDPWFVQNHAAFGADLARRAMRWLKEDIRLFANLVAAEACVADADRREELARRCLEALEIRPAGESAAQAADRLATLDVVEQHRVMLETRERNRRALRLRQKMREERARAAAARWARE